MTRIIRTLFVSLAFATFFALPATSQAVNPDVTLRGNTAVYYLARAEDIKINASIFGDVTNPGLYVLPRGFRLDKVLAAAGGPALGERFLQDERTVTVRISRETANGRLIIYDETFDEMMLARAAYPVMEEGDIVMVEKVTKQGFSRRDIFPIIGAAGTVVSIVLAALTLSRTGNSSSN